MEIMTSEAYLSTLEKGRAKRPRARQQNKAPLFAELWKRYAPKGAPRLTAEYKFAACVGRRYRADFKVGRFKLLIELDGGQFQSKGGRHARDTDRDKCNLATALGYRIFHFSPQQLERDPLGCINLVLQAAHWKGKLL